jgi:hypothetical protein
MTMNDELITILPNRGSSPHFVIRFKTSTPVTVHVLLLLLLG